MDYGCFIMIELLFYFQRDQTAGYFQWSINKQICEY